MSSTNLLGPWAAFGSAMTWAIGVHFYSQLTKRYSPFAVNFYRSATAFIVFLIWTLYLFKTFPLPPRENAFWLTTSVFSSYGFGDALFLWSSQWIGVSTALAITALYPAWAALAAWFLRGQVLSFFSFMGLLMAIAGVIVVIQSSSRIHKAKKNLNFGKGVLLALVVSFFWGYNSYAVALGGLNLPLASANAFRMLMGAIICFSLHFLMRVRMPIYIPVKEYSKFSAVFFIESVGGGIFYLYGLTHTPVAIGAVLSSLAPLLSSFIGTVFFKEHLNIGQWLGTALAVLGVALLIGN